MSGATAAPITGGVRTRQKTLAIAIAGQPSSSIDSQHSTCDAAVHAAASPGSTHTAAGNSSSRLNCSPVQQNIKEGEQVDNLQQQPAFVLHKPVQADASIHQQPVTTRSRSRVSPVEGTQLAPAQQSSQRQHRSHNEHGIEPSGSQRASTRSRTRIAAAAPPPPAVQFGADNTIQKSSTAAPKLQGKSSQLQQQRQQRSGAKKHQELQQAASQIVATRRRSRLSDGSHNPKLQAPASKRSRRQQAAYTAAATSITGEQGGLAVLRQATAATAAAPHIDGCTAEQNTAAQELSPVSAAAAAGPEVMAPSAGSDVGPASEEEESEEEESQQDDAAQPPPGSLRARFARLTAEQQWSILVELEQLTEMEEARRARQAVRLAAAAARKQKREAVRGQERRSSRHCQLLEREREGLGSRTGTPETTRCVDTPDPAAAAKCNNRLPEGMQGPAAATAGERGDNNDTVDSVAVSALAAAANCLKQATAHDAAEPCVIVSRDPYGRKLARGCSGRSAGQGASSSPEPAAAVAERAGAVHDTMHTTSKWLAP